MYGLGGGGGGGGWYLRQHTGKKMEATKLHTATCPVRLRYRDQNHRLGGDQNFQPIMSLVSPLQTIFFHLDIFFDHKKFYEASYREIFKLLLSFPPMDLVSIFELVVAKKEKPSKRHLLVYY